MAPCCRRAPYLTKLHISVHSRYAITPPDTSIRPILTSAMQQSQRKTLRQTRRGPRFLATSTIGLLVVYALVPAASFAQERDESLDAEYGSKILEYTTHVRFVNPLVDHLPASDDVPSPLDVFGTIIGAPDVLHTTAEIYDYFAQLAAASPRVATRSIGQSEEGRQMIEVIVSSEENIANLDGIRRDLNRLADPRVTSAEDAGAIFDRGVPIYYITAGLHSPETGSPEMVMELAYRLAVSETEMIRGIRDNVVLIFVPVVETDGRDRIVDSYRYRAANDSVGPGLPYWGAYAAHDNNRDGYGLALNLTRNVLASFLHWKPQIMHDLHESVPYLYTSTGLGPYNEHIDPITVNEWHNLAHEEVGVLTSMNMPGVWTHAFYNGWAANYLIWIANLRNATGRFYETFGNSIPETVERELSSRQTSREWYRTNPPLEKVTWSLRNNTNYMQSGVLTALNYIAENRRETLSNFYLKSARSLEKGRTEAPYAWIIPREQTRRLATARLVNLLIDQGLEIHEATGELSWRTGDDSSNVATADAGDFVVRMDQPYRTLAQVLLDEQNFPDGARPPYDDTGWTLPYLHQVRAFRVADSTILEASMRRVETHVMPEGGVDGSGRYYLLANTTDDEIAVFRFRLPGVRMDAAERKFVVDGVEYPAGSLVIDSRDNSSSALREIDDVASSLGLVVQRTSAVPDVPKHDVEVPRVGLVHTWVATPQDAGWWHFAFDEIGIPYTYLSEQDLATQDLSEFDVLIMPRAFASPQQLVAGNSAWLEILCPGAATGLIPSLGHIDETDDVRRGMGYEGLARLKQFIESGGVFITEGSTTAFPIDMAITQARFDRHTGESAGTRLSCSHGTERLAFADRLRYRRFTRGVLQCRTRLPGRRRS